jgi:hypothetical protein
VSDRVPSDHEAIPSHRTHREQVGRTGRPRIPLPDALDVSVGDVIRLSLEGEEYHAQVTQSRDGGREVCGAFFDAQVARTDGEGQNYLTEWADDVGLAVGDPVVLDVITPGYKFGLRRPGERVVYEATDAPSSSLSDIARNLDG